MSRKPTPEKLRVMFTYNPETGELRWKQPLRYSNAIPGEIAGCIHKKSGRRVLSVRHRQYKATRVIWAIMTGKWPDRDVDHKDTYGPKADWGDRWENLRLATDSQNGMNRRIMPNNTSGYPGVVWHARDERWQAQIWKDKKAIHLGQFLTKKDAIAARQAAELELFGEYRANHRLAER